MVAVTIRQDVIHRHRRELDELVHTGIEFGSDRVVSALSENAAIVINRHANDIGFGGICFDRNGVQSDFLVDAETKCKLTHCRTFHIECGWQGVRVAKAGKGVFTPDALKSQAGMCAKARPFVVAENDVVSMCYRLQSRVVARIFRKRPQPNTFVVALTH